MKGDRPKCPSPDGPTGRTPRSLGKRDYRPLLRRIWKMRKLRQSVKATADAVRQVMPENTELATGSIGNMLVGKDPMNPDVFSALAEWSRLRREDLESPEFMSSVDRIDSALAAAGEGLHDQLRHLCQGSAGRIALKLCGIELQKVVEALPTEIQLRANQAHTFDLHHDNLSGARLVLLEYDHKERSWWSLLDNTGAMIGSDHHRRTISAVTTLGRDNTSTLRLQIGGDTGIYEIFAIVSKEDFPESVMTMLCRDDGGRSVPRVDDERLMGLFSRWMAGTRTPPLVASFIYAAR